LLVLAGTRQLRETQTRERKERKQAKAASGLREEFFIIMWFREEQFITGSFLLLTSNRFKSLRPRFLCYGTGIVAAPHLYKQQLADCLLFDPFASGTRVIRDRQGAVQLPVLPTLELS